MQGKTALTITSFSNSDIFSSNKIIYIFLLLFCLQLPSLAPIIRYLHIGMYWFLPSYLIIFVIFYFFLLSKSLQSLYFQKLLDSSFTTLILLLFLLIINAILYHHELVLQSIGRGTDARDALTFTGYNLVHGYFPYSHLTYLKNPESAGPGLIIFALPFTYSGSYGLLIPLLITTSAFAIKIITRSAFNTNLYLLCLFSSPAVMQFLAEANDYLIIGLVYGLIAVVLFYFWGKNWLYDISFIVFIGVLATARLNFFYLAPLLGFFIWKRNKKQGIYFALTGLLITLSIHIGFYLWNPHHYTPLYVIHYARYTFNNAYGLSILISACVLSGIITIAAVKNTLGSWLFFLWLCLTTPLAVGALFCLMNEHWNIQGIGLGYITLTAPILIMWISMCHKNKI
ncbi:MAG: hypothetical protein A3E81_01835 [Gammaproteobacteria bacterium RIFCSPHIGHO2_12_FULL_36_30]|nr:MAG: hypothetical protein A3E81_01835 [Gammaproteobacteria bacterium RIFCSPHIGHO2_12_FULL_36_30]